MRWRWREAGGRWSWVGREKGWVRGRGCGGGQPEAHKRTQKQHVPRIATKGAFRVRTPHRVSGCADGAGCGPGPYFFHPNP